VSSILTCTGAALTRRAISYYKETEKVLGQTFEMCILQDFEAITPNLLARTIETVEGGGLIILTLKTMSSLKQLYTMTMVCFDSPVGLPGSLQDRTFIQGTDPPLVPLLSHASTSVLFSPLAPVRTVWYWTTNSTFCRSPGERTSRHWTILL
jgi:hypothetical protein